MNYAAFLIHPNVTLHSKIPLIAFLGLRHFGVSEFIFVFRRRWSIDNARIDNRACFGDDAFIQEQPIHSDEKFFLQPVDALDDRRLLLELSLEPQA